MEAKFEEWKKGVTFKATDDDNDDDTIEESSEVSDTTSEQSES